MARSNLQEIGLQRFALGQTANSAAITDAASNVLNASTDRAYVVVELRSVTGGDVFFAVGTTALDEKGQRLLMDKPVKIFTKERISIICGTAAQTGVVIFQDFSVGVDGFEE